MDYVIYVKQFLFRQAFRKEREHKYEENEEKGKEKRRERKERPRKEHNKKRKERRNNNGTITIPLISSELPTPALPASC